jgi:hypothetical protein
MRAVIRIVLIITLLLGLAGCYSVIKMPDITTAAVYGPQISGGPLSPQKVARLSIWMKAHDAGWMQLMETPPVSITMAIVMHDPNGQQSSLDLFEAKDGSAIVYFFAPSPATPLKRYLPEADVVALKAAVEN